MFTKGIVLSLLVVLFSVYYRDNVLKLFFNVVNPKEKSGQVKLFTAEELSTYNGVDRPQLYLSLLGIVFDVTKGKKHYGPKQAYNFFVGKDASRNFITGEFNTNDLSAKVADLGAQSLRSLNNWLKFYRKDYTEIGKLIGQYYNDNGELTAYGAHVWKLIQEAELNKQNEDMDKLKFPPCNVEWDAQTGSRVWCTKRSGGVERNWIGKPRQFYEPGSQTYRCACINEENEKLGNIKEYEGCEKNSDSCYVNS